MQQRPRRLAHRRGRQPLRRFHQFLGPDDSRPRARRWCSMPSARPCRNSLSFGAPTHREVEMAELIRKMVPSIEKVRLVNSGTEACMSAIRAARGYTGRAKIIKFEGCYHGHGDAFLIAAGSGALTAGEPDSAGVTQGVAQDTLTAPYNDLPAVAGPPRRQSRRGCGPHSGARGGQYGPRGPRRGLPARRCASSAPSTASCLFSMR